MWLIHMKIGIVAAYVPHDVPVPTDNIHVTINAITATLLPLIPIFKAAIITLAPTPVVMKKAATP